MKTIKKLIIVLLLILPIAMVAEYLFKTLDARDGLTSSQINCIMKDSRSTRRTIPFRWVCLQKLPK